MSNTDEKKISKSEKIFFEQPEEKPKRVNGMTIETYLHMIGVKEDNRAGQIVFAKKRSEAEKLSFEDWKEILISY